MAPALTTGDTTPDVAVVFTSAQMMTGILPSTPPGNLQSNQAAEIIVIYKVASMAQKWFPLKIISDSLYAINGLTKHLSTWEDNGWIGIDNAPLFKLTAAMLRSSGLKVRCA